MTRTRARRHDTCRGVPLLRRARRLRGAVEPDDAGLDPARAALSRTVTARRPHVDEERRPEVRGGTQRNLLGTTRRG